MVARLPGTEGTGEVAVRIRARRGGALRPLDAVLLHSPPVADGWNALLGAIRQRMSLPAAIRELVILRIAVVNGVRYEWVAHEADARRAGLGDAELAAIAVESIEDISDGAAVLDGRQRRVLAYTDAMTRQVHVSDEIFDSLRPDFSAAELVELTTTIAAYNMVSRFLAALQVDLPEPVAAGA